MKLLCGTQAFSDMGLDTTIHDPRPAESEDVVWGFGRGAAGRAAEARKRKGADRATQAEEKAENRKNINDDNTTTEPQESREGDPQGRGEAI